MQSPISILTVTEAVAYFGGRLQELNMGCRIPGWKI